jgi:hypothetical protein
MFKTPKSQNIKEGAVTSPPPKKPFYVLVVHGIIAGYTKRPSPFNEYLYF